jgi:predicted transcriptional regulator
MRASKEMSTVEQRVEELLRTMPDTRDSDKLLVVLYLREYHNVYYLTEILENTKVPQLETITRARRHLQSLGMYEALEKVSELRDENQVLFQDYYGG